MTEISIAMILAMQPILDLPTATWQPSREKRGEAFNLDLEIKKQRAVVLIHGLKLHLINTSLSTEPEIHDWQKPSSALVRELSKDFDVYAFGYAQTLPLDAVCMTTGLNNQVRALKKAGYKDITLIGHSAGGIIAKQYVETYPECGVTKVIQVAAPNSGSIFADIGVGVPKPQVPFIKSMSPEHRIRVLARSKAVPDHLQFASVVCKAGRLTSDTVVSMQSQWPEELQKQGIPAALCMVNHFNAMKDTEAVTIIGELAREKLVRWNESQVSQGKKHLFETSFGRGLGLGILKQRP